MKIFFFGGGGQIRKEWRDVGPKRTRFYYWGFYVCANFGENRSRNATVRVLTDGQIDSHTDRHKLIL